MKDKIMRIKLNRQITQLKKQMKKQEQEIEMLLKRLDAMESKGKEIVVKKVNHEVS